MNQAPVIRVGLGNPGSQMAIAMETRGLPVMVSANALFDHERKCFKEPPPQLMDLDVALDSAGFVAMKRYGRFPWSIAQYVDLALMGGFSWWSSMDCCCEPEVAGDRATVQARVLATAQLLSLCRSEYQRRCEGEPELHDAVGYPMPILQGWEADDYLRSAELTNGVLAGEWPSLIGIGSVCRRHLKGPGGLWRILHAVDQVLPPHVKLHLFGVKGTAIEGLQHHPRVASVDSMAFEFSARIVAREAGVSKTTALRVNELDRWLERQTRVSEDAGQLCLSV